MLNVKLFVHHVTSRLLKANTVYVCEFYLSGRRKCPILATEGINSLKPSPSLCVCIHIYIEKGSTLKNSSFYSHSVLYGSQNVGRDSSVGNATPYRLVGRRDFPHPSRPALWPNQPPIQWVQNLSRGESAAGA